MLAVLIQAETAYPPLKFKVEPAPSETQSLTPSKLKALPILPVVQVAPVTAPVFVPAESVAAVPDVSSSL